MDILTLQKAVKQAKKYTPANPVPGEWEPTKVAEGLDILAGSRIVEQDSNENGEYVRWENGLQICRRDVSLVEITPALAPNEFARLLDYSYPAAFVTTPYADSVGALYTAGGYYRDGIISLRSSVTNMWAINGLNLSTFGVEQVRNLRLIAIGRWR